eukprot:364381-Chlamydomonas_euryale.AAC.6
MDSPHKGRTCCEDDTHRVHLSHPQHRAKARFQPKYTRPTVSSSRMTHRSQALKYMNASQRSVGGC